MRVLIAEDDEQVLKLLCAFISDLGYEVEGAANGLELVKLALAARPDLIVTDMHMPEMAGDSMIAMLDMYPPLASVPVIMVTGATSGELAGAGVAREIVVLPKPVDLARLEAEVKKAVRKAAEA